MKQENGLRNTSKNITNIWHTNGDERVTSISVLTYSTWQSLNLYFWAPCLMTNTKRIRSVLPADRGAGLTAYVLVQFSTLTGLLLGWAFLLLTITDQLPNYSHTCLRLVCSVCKDIHCLSDEHQKDNELNLRACHWAGVSILLHAAFDN